MTVSGDATVLLSAFLRLSSGAGVERNQPLTRDCAGDVSGLGDSEGKDVRLLVSTSGEGALLRLRLSDVLELRFEGRMRCMLRFRGLDMVELCDAVRTKSTALGGSIAAMFVERDYEHAHPYSRVGDCTGKGTSESECVCEYVMRGLLLFACIGCYCAISGEAVRHTIWRGLDMSPHASLYV